jgi:hypothetical protein
LKALLEALRTEQEKRARLRGLPVNLADARRQFYEMLDLMHERRKTAPGYVEPDSATGAAQLRELDSFFAERYPRG